MYLTNSEFYGEAPDVKAFIHGILYIVNAFYSNAMMTQILRDEDICFPPTTDNYR